MIEHKASAMATSGGTVAAGLGTYLELIPGIAGCLASVTGLVLSVVLIVCHCNKMRDAKKKGVLDRRLLHLKIKALEEKEETRLKEDDGPKT